MTAAWSREVFRTGRPARAADVEGLVDLSPSEDVEFLRRFRVQTMMVGAAAGAR